MLISVSQTADIYKFLQLLRFFVPFAYVLMDQLVFYEHLTLIYKSNTDIILEHLNFKWFNKNLILHFTPNLFLGVNFIFVSCNLLGKSHLAQNIQPCNCVTRIIEKDKIFSICVF